MEREWMVNKEEQTRSHRKIGPFKILKGEMERNLSDGGIFLKVAEVIEMNT